MAYFLDDHIVFSIIQIGYDEQSGGKLLSHYLEMFRGRDDLNLLPYEHWLKASDEFNADEDKQLVWLFKGMVVLERELNWFGGSASAAIDIYKIIEQKGYDKDFKIAEWALRNSNNPWIPFGEENHGDTTIEEYLAKKIEGAEYNEWRESLGGKSILEVLAETNEEKQEDLHFILVIPDEEMDYIFRNENFENIWAKEAGNDKYTLYMVIHTYDDALSLGISKERKYYHCKLNRLILTEGKYENELPCGVYEFEIVCIPELEFSYTPDLRHVGKIFYMDRNLFEEMFVIPIYMEGEYDQELRNTIGFEMINFN